GDNPYLRHRLVAQKTLSKEQVIQIRNYAGNLREPLAFLPPANGEITGTARLSSVCDERHDLSFRLWSYVPVPLSLLRPDKLPVVIEDHPAVGVSHFERERGRVVEVRQVIAR